MRTQNRFILSLTVLFTFFFFSFAMFTITQAQNPVGYAPLVSFPGVEEGTKTGLASWLTAAFKALIGVAGVLAVVVIVIGGIQYIIAVVPSSKTEAKNKIVNALLGLLLALGAWLILQAINPQLLRVGLNVPELAVQGTNQGSSTLPPGVSVNTELYCYDIKGKSARSNCSETKCCSQKLETCSTQARSDGISASACTVTPASELCGTATVVGTTVCNENDSIWGLCYVTTATGEITCSGPKTLSECQNLKTAIIDAGGRTITEDCKVPAPTAPPPPSSGDKITHSEGASLLQTAGIPITSTGNCFDPNIRTCTSLEGMRRSTLDRVIAFKSECGCSFNVTGGTEVGHASGALSHANGYKIDISVNGGVNSYITSHYTFVGKRTSDGADIYRDTRGNEFALESSPAHWDITVP